MTALSSIISAGGGGGSTRAIADKVNKNNVGPGMSMVFGNSQSFTPATTMTAIVTAVGAGGSGAHMAQSYWFSATGGSAGGMCQSELVLTAGVTYTFSVGAGGTKQGPGNSTGYPGGDTIVSGSDIATMTAGGGLGGGYHYQINSTATTWGGSASGGNIANRTGGGSQVQGYPKAAGGGAVGFYDSGKYGACTDATHNGTHSSEGAGCEGIPMSFGFGACTDGGDRLWDTNYANSAGAGQAFAGGGGARVNTTAPYLNSGYACIGGRGGIGGGGGAAISYGSAQCSTIGGQGGNGIIILQFI